MSRDEAVWHAESIIGPLEAKYFSRSRRALGRRQSATSAKRAASGASTKRPSSRTAARPALGGKRSQAKRAGSSNTRRPVKGRQNGRNTVRRSSSKSSRRSVVHAR